MPDNRVLVSSSSLSDIGDSIRGKLGVETTYYPSEMAGAIDSIPSDLGTKSITANGTYDASDDSLDGYSEVTVNVPSGTQLGSGDVGKVVVESGGSYSLAQQTSLSVSSNGTYDTTTKNSVEVTVSGGQSSPTLLTNSDQNDVLDNVYYLDVQEKVEAANGTVVDAFDSTVVLASSLNMSIDSQSKHDGMLDVSFEVTNRESQNVGVYCSIQVSGLTVGSDYTLTYDCAHEFVGNFDTRISGSNPYGVFVADYAISSNNYSSTDTRYNCTNIQYKKNTFRATATSMYVNFTLSALPLDEGGLVHFTNMAVRSGARVLTLGNFFMFDNSDGVATDVNVYGIYTNSFNGTNKGRKQLVRKFSSGLTSLTAYAVILYDDSSGSGTSLRHMLTLDGLSSGLLSIGIRQQSATLIYGGSYQSSDIDINRRPLVLALTYSSGTKPKMFVKGGTTKTGASNWSGTCTGITIGQSGFQSRVMYVGVVSGVDSDSVISANLTEIYNYIYSTRMR